MTSEKNDQSGGTPEVQDLVINLDFVPQWARKDPGTSTAEIKPSRRDAGSRKPRRDGDRRGPRPGRSGARRQGDRSGAPSRERGRDRSRREARPRVEKAPVRVSFIPDRDCLSKVVQLIRRSKRAYALADIAGRFLTKPEFFSVKYTVDTRRAGEDTWLYQSKSSGYIFLDEKACEAHAVERLLALRFDREEVEVDPPSGNFTCVGRCSMNGALLGPPNHHDYHEQIEKLRIEKFPDWTSDNFRRKIEVVHDPEVVEQWKTSLSREVKFKEKGSEEAELITHKQAESAVREKFLARDVHRTHRVIVPGPAAIRLEDERLGYSTRSALEYEKRSLFSISLALRPALKHMHLHVFRVGKSDSYVIDVRPAPLSPGKVVEEIRSVLEYLTDHPGCKREELLAALCPGAAADSPEVIHELSSLRWLIDRGHLIEFFDGSLSVPRGGR